MRLFFRLQVLSSVCLDDFYAVCAVIILSAQQKNTHLSRNPLSISIVAKKPYALLWGGLCLVSASCCPAMAQIKNAECFLLAQKNKKIPQVCALQFYEEKITKILTAS